MSKSFREAAARSLGATVTGLRGRALLVAVIVVAVTTSARGADGAKPISFVRDVRPILARNCFACHGPDEKHREAELRLDTRDGAVAEHDGRRAVVPSDLAKSELVRRITSTKSDEQMPPKDSGKMLTPEQIDILKNWIEQGASWGTHWSFEKPVRPAQPNEIAALARLYESRRAYFASHPDEATKFASDPLGPIPDGMSATELAAFTAVCNVILNLDEFLTRG